VAVLYVPLGRVRWYIVIFLLYIYNFVIDKVVTLGFIVATAKLYDKYSVLPALGNQSFWLFIVMIPAPVYGTTGGNCLKQ
jgi:hypothetical protein